MTITIESDLAPAVTATITNKFEINHTPPAPVTPVESSEELDVDPERKKREQGERDEERSQKQSQQLAEQQQMREIQKAISMLKLRQDLNGYRFAIETNDKKEHYVQLLTNSGGLVATMSGQAAIALSHKSSIEPIIFSSDR